MQMREKFINSANKIEHLELCNLKQERMFDLTNILSCLKN